MAKINVLYIVCVYFENFLNVIYCFIFYLNELHGWMTQWPAVFWRIRSLTNAFLLPNNFIANRLSVGWNHDCSWFFKKFDDIFSLIVCMFGNSSSFGVPYNETSSKWTYKHRFFHVPNSIMWPVSCAIHREREREREPAKSIHNFCKHPYDKRCRRYRYRHQINHKKKISRKKKLVKRSSFYSIFFWALLKASFFAL